MRAKKHILIVDDVSTNLKYMTELLKGEYTLSLTKSGKQALSIAGKIHPDLIVLDVKMPEMDGYETIEAIHAKPGLEKTPFVFFSADSDVQIEERGKKLGAADFIRKSDEPSVVLDKIARALN